MSGKIIGPPKRPKRDAYEYEKSFVVFFHAYEKICQWSIMAFKDKILRSDWCDEVKKLLLNDEVKEVINQIFKIVLEAGLVIGTVAGTGDQAKALIEKGALFCLNSVQGLIKNSASEYLK